MTETVYLLLWKFEALLPETDSESQISVMVNIRFLSYYYKCTKLTFNWSYNF